MDIIGGGFLAANFGVLSSRHPDVTLVAAGASSTQAADDGGFARESAMLAGILDDCRRRDRTVLMFSTASHAMYGDTSSPAAEDDPSPDASPFGRHKLALEEMAAASGARWLVVRLSHAVGAGQRPHQFFPAMVRGVREGRVRIYRDCHRDLLDVVDAVRAVDALLSAGVTERVVNVASGDPYPVEVIVDQIERRLGVRAERELIDTAPSRTLVSIARLRGLVPGLDWPAAGVSYLSGLVRRYAPLC